MHSKLADQGALVQLFNRVVVKIPVLHLDFNAAVYDEHKVITPVASLDDVVAALIYLLLHKELYFVEKVVLPYMHISLLRFEIVNLLKQLDFKHDPFILILL